MPSQKPTYTLRIDKEVLDNIRSFANVDGRSLNKEIEIILHQYAIERAFNDPNVLGVRNRISDISNTKKKN